jgi:hypothetical protein
MDVSESLRIQYGWTNKGCGAAMGCRGRFLANGFISVMVRGREEAPGPSPPQVSFKAKWHRTLASRPSLSFPLSPVLCAIRHNIGFRVVPIFLFVHCSPFLANLLPQINGRRVLASPFDHRVSCSLHPSPLKIPTVSLSP